MADHKIILTRGIQGSGKSTWAKKWCEEEPLKRIRWNNDDFRRMMGKILGPATRGDGCNHEGDVLQGGYAERV